MEIRAIERQAITVPATDGTVVYLTIQNRHAHRTAEGGRAVFDGQAGLYFGNRSEIVGEVWVGKKVSRLVVERAHGG